MADTTQTPHNISVCLYTATQLPSEAVHVVTTVGEHVWKSSSKQGPVPDWEQEEHVFEATQSITHVSFSVVSSATGQVLATATHPLQQAAAWGSERCRLPLQACDGAAGGGLNIRLEVKERRVEEGVATLTPNDRGVSVTISGKALETEEVIRGYLGQHIGPVLKDALYEVVQQKPADPLRFVGEFLLRKAS